MEVIVEAVIASLVDNLINTSTYFLDHIFGGKACRVVAEMQTILRDLRCFLQDAEDKKQDDPIVRQWLEDLEEFTYDAEDVLEKFNYEALRYQVALAKLPCEISSRWWSFLKTSWSKFEMLDKLDAVSKRMKRLKARKETLNLLPLSVRTFAKKKWTRDPSVSLPSEPAIFARDEEKEAIIRMLLTQEEEDPRIMVIPIVGMGGLGKTTLARYVYNDSRVEISFEVRGWVCISSDYDNRRISKEILQSVCKNCGEVADKNLDWIQCKLGEELRNKKFLLVLDDNWNDKYADWDALRPPFLQGSSGSRIIVTTRSHNVANTVGGGIVDSITPRYLSNYDCWSLLSTHAGLDQNATSLSRFEEIGKKIARRCSGLPLAAMSVGGLLRNKRRVEQWEAILNRMLKDRGDDVMSVLKMSYDDLDSVEKRCFSFLSLLPEDYEFEEDEVVLLWVGAGLIQLDEKGKSKKEMGHEVFYGLLSRSLLLQRRDCFQMHDLIRDVAKQVCRINRHIANGDPIDESFESIRHLSFYIFKFRDIVYDGVVKEKKLVLPLRSFWALDNTRWHFLVDLYQVENVFTRLKFIRVLDLRYLMQEKLPESIGQLTLLRYLNVSYSSIRMLPTTVTSLYKLEILILNSCSKQLPEKIGNLINLCYLDITDTYYFEELPEGITKLRRLQYLSDFKIGKKSPVSSLGNLNLLQGSLTISNLENVASPKDATSARLSDKRIEKLTLSWDSRLQHRSKRAMECNQGILERLQPSKDLKEFNIWYYGGSKLPHWVTGSFRYLAELSLNDCYNCTSRLEVMDSLKSFRIVNCREMTVFFQKMPQLKYLEIGNCKEVTCTETFNLDSLDCLDLVSLDPESMSPLFKEKLRLGSRHARLVQFVDSRYPTSVGLLPHWILPSINLIEDDFSGQMMVEYLWVVQQHSLYHLPKWVSNALSLQYLSVERCSSLKILLPYREFRSSLTKLYISQCSELESFHEEKLPTTIQELWIDDCSALEKKFMNRDQQLCSEISHIPVIRVNKRTISLV